MIALIRLPHSLVDFFKQLNIFKRNKKPVELKIVAIAEYMSHGSVRKTANNLSRLFMSVSKSSVHRYAKKFAKHAFMRQIKPKHHSIVAIDETVVKVNGRRWYVWVAIDAETKELITFHVSKGRNWLEALMFLKKLKRMCLGKLPLVLVDKGPWYRDVLHRLGFEYLHQTFCMRGYVERFFGYLKDRSRVFYNNINCKHEYRTLVEFVRMFCYWYLEWR